MQPKWYEAGAKDYGWSPLALTTLEFLLLGFLEVKRYQGFKKTGQARPPPPIRLHRTGPVSGPGLQEDRPDASSSPKRCTAQAPSVLCRQGCDQRARAAAPAARIIAHVRAAHLCRQPAAVLHTWPAASVCPPSATFT